MREGIVFLLIGPSAAGKNTVQEKVLEHFPYMHAAKGCWTRPHRPGETDETADSISISVEEFMQLKNAGALTAVNHVHGNWYGTRLAEFTEPVKRGQPVLRIVTDAGADAVITDLSETLIVTIYLEVPIHVVVERLLARGDKPEDIVRRVKTAEGELACLDDDRDQWDYVIDAIETPDKVAEQVISIIEDEITAQENDQKHWTLYPETDGRVAAGNAVYNALVHVDVPIKGEPLGMPPCHSCKHNTSRIVMNSVALCRDCVETMAGTIR